MQVCRICLQHFEDSDCVSFKEDTSGDISIQCKLSTCIPQMKIHLVTESVLCSPCLTSLNFVYNFVKTCLEADSKIDKLVKDSYNITNLNEMYEVADTKLIEDIKNELEIEIVKIEEVANEIENDAFVEHNEAVREDIKPTFKFLNFVEPKKVFIKCTKCDYKTNRKQDLQRHFNTVHKNEWLECKVCKYECQSTFYLHKHIVEAHSKDDSLVCDICGAQFNQYKLLRRHHALHGDEKPYMCDICGQTYRGKNALKHHIKKHKGEKPFTCSVCSYTCISSYLLKMHKRIHTGEKPYLCELCGLQTASNSHFIYHKQLHLGKKRFKCELCDYQCLAKSSLNLHLRLHSGEKPFECYHCSYRAVTRQHLLEHIRMHTGEKPYACEFCEHKTSRRSHLKIHLRKHPQYKPISKHLKCNICSFTTTIPVSMQEHEWSHILEYRTAPS